jgi:DNA-binding CsgD family transcriptional regulator
MADDGPSRSTFEEEALRTLREGHAYIQSLPAEERHIATMAAEGQPVWQIAAQVRVSEEAVAHLIDRVLAALSGRDIDPVETGGLGADTDPGISGGYDPEPFGGNRID